MCCICANAFGVADADADNATGIVVVGADVLVADAGPAAISLAVVIDDVDCSGPYCNVFVLDRTLNADLSLLSLSCLPTAFLITSSFLTMPEC